MKKIDFIKKAQRKLLDEHNTDMCYVRIDEIISVFESLGMLPPVTEIFTEKQIAPKPCGTVLWRDVIHGWESEDE